MHPTIEGAHDIGEVVTMATVALGRSQEEKLLPMLVTIMNNTHKMFKNELPEVLTKVEEH